jgi:multimeric flavodoxin WrbA
MLYTVSMDRVLAILGSSRAQGNTWLTLSAVLAGRNADVVDLADAAVSYYDYEHRNAGDSFLALAERMAEADVIIFATPVYWYAMSAQMKTLFDRLTDLISVCKEVGRRLRGKRVYVIASGTDPQLPEGFEVPFQRTCEYLGLIFQGAFYGHIQEDLALSPETRSAAEDFARRVFGR